MSKQSVHSIIYRRRPLSSDVSRFVEGIAASLRSFHVSVSMADTQDRGPVLPRSKRLAAAAAEVSSLSPSRLVDARSLAAAPPTTFRIAQVVSSARGATHGGSGLRGGSGRIGGAAGIRGPNRHRGSGKAFGRAPDPRRRRGKTKNPEFLDHSSDEPNTPEEQAYIDKMEMGVEVPYQVGKTVKEALELDFPPVAIHSVPDGLISTIRDRMGALTGQHGNELEVPQEHAKRYLKGNGTVVVDNEDLARAASVAPHTYKTLGEAERSEILQTFVAGRYQALKEPAIGDPLGAVETYGLKNETYLPRDREMLKAKIRELLSAKKAAPQPKQAKRS